jgi:addiction module HigA family antidote
MAKKGIKRDPNREPAHPGRILRTISFPHLKEEKGKSLADIAVDLGVTRQALYKLTKEQSAMSPEMAVKISHYLGGKPGVWLRMQAAFDIWHAERKIDLTKIPSMKVA